MIWVGGLVAKCIACVHVLGNSRGVLHLELSGLQGGS